MTCSQDVVLITGASSGIGYACALEAMANGAQHLLLTGRCRNRLHLARENLLAAHTELQRKRPKDIKAIETSTQASIDITLVVCDQSDAEQVARFVEYLRTSEIVPRKIIANVGVNPVHDLGPKKAANTSLALLRNTLNTNVIHLHQWLAPQLKGLQRGGAAIVLVGSQAYQWGIKGQLAYNLSKSALVGYKNTLVSEYGHRGVFCHLLNPGLVANQRTLNLRQQLGEEHSVTEQQVAQAIWQLLGESKQNGLEINV